MPPRLLADLWNSPAVFWIVLCTGLVLIVLAFV